jgi:hypothetical protein
MMGKTILLATSALIASSLLAGPAMAQVSQSEYDALQARVEKLEADSADSNASLGVATGNTNSRLGTLESGWWKNTTISGRMYWDITSINQKSDGVKGSSNGVGFDIKRFYVGIDHKFDDVFSANVTTDVSYSSATNLNVYIKKAYGEAKLSDALDVKVGSADMPWIPFAEGVYGYRQIENTLIDRTKYGNSADWGVHASGKLADGVIEYAVSAVNGGGYKNPTRSEGVDFEGRVSLNYMGFIAAVGGYTGDLGKKVVGVTTTHTATRFDALAAYTAMGARIGVEYFQANDWHNVTKNYTEDATGYSAFASYQFDPEWSAFGRYDWVTTDNNYAPAALTSPDVKDNYYNIGIQYSPAKIVDIALVYKHDDAKNGNITTSNGASSTIGGSTNGSGHSGSYDEVGIWGQFRW